MEALDDGPGAVPGAVVDQEDPAFGGNLPLTHELFQLFPQPPGRLRQDRLLVVAGDNYI